MLLFALYCTSRGWVPIPAIFIYKVFLLSREEQRDNRLWNAMCYSTLAASTLIIMISRNVEIFKKKISIKIKCEEVLLEYPGTFHIFNMEFSKRNNYSTLKC